MTEVQFDARAAAVYDETSAVMFEPAVVEPTVDFLADLARGRPALELAIGTGRIALPLSARGVEVHGIDISEPMVDRLRSKPGSERIDVTIGDFATTRVDGAFGLVYLVFNTIGNVETQDEQVDIFCNAAAHLEPGGVFVIEVGIPQLQRLPPGDRSHVAELSPTHVCVDEFELSDQIEWSHHWYMADGHWEHFSGAYRYVWPAELDLMARIAGLRLRERVGGWDRSRFTSKSGMHVSVWEKPHTD
ncbi:MAG TPA: class I SAM-dependent methyltransferase [Acidimicrobiia bacterium]|jgi:SAM-dependent methyltransferase